MDFLYYDTNINDVICNILNEDGKVMIKHIMFIIAYCTSFWQYYEYAYTLYEYNLIESPIWSGTFGFPLLHHGYFGFGIVLIIYVKFHGNMVVSKIRSFIG